MYIHIYGSGQLYLSAVLMLHSSVYPFVPANYVFPVAAAAHLLHCFLLCYLPQQILRGGTSSHHKYVGLARTIYIYRDRRIALYEAFL